MPSGYRQGGDGLLKGLIDCCEAVGGRATSPRPSPPRRRRSGRPLTVAQLARSTPWTGLGDSKRSCVRWLTRFRLYDLRPSLLGFRPLAARVPILGQATEIGQLYWRPRHVTDRRKW